MHQPTDTIRILIIEDCTINAKIASQKITRSVTEFNKTKQTTINAVIQIASNKEQAEEHLSLTPGTTATERFDIVLFDNDLGQGQTSAGAELFVAFKQKIKDMSVYTPTCIGISSDPQKLADDIQRLYGEESSSNTSSSLDSNYTKHLLSVSPVANRLQLIQSQSPQPLAPLRKQELTRQLTHEFRREDSVDLDRLDNIVGPSTTITDTPPLLARVSAENIGTVLMAPTTETDSTQDKIARSSTTDEPPIYPKASPFCCWPSHFFREKASVTAADDPQPQRRFVPVVSK